MVSNFLFHRVNPNRDQLWDPMDNRLFERCLSYLKNHFELVRLEDYAPHTLRSEKDRLATIMFDDGYKDNFTEAAPVLNKYNIKASFYVVTDCIDFNIPTWTHELEYRFAHTSRAVIDLPFSSLPISLQHATFASAAERINYVRRLKPVLKTISHRERTQLLAAVKHQLPDVELPLIMMSWDDCRALVSEGHYIGSHTVSHGMLGTMEDDAEVVHELLGSKKRIEQELGYSPKTISYPVGSYNDRVKKLAEKGGYTIGLAVNQTRYNPEHHDCFEIPRIELYNEPWLKTKLRITNRLEHLKRLIRYR